MFRFPSFRRAWLFAAGATVVPLKQVTASITREFDEIYVAGPAHQLVVDATQLELSITGTDREDIAMHMVWDADTNDAEKAEERFERLRLEARESSDRTVLKLHSKKKKGWFSWGNSGTTPKVRMELQVPSRIDLVIDTTSGDVVIRTVAGTHRIDTVSGDVQLEACTGDHQVESTSGKLVLRGSPGNHELNTTSGDILVEGGRGDISADSTSGSIRIVDFPGAHRADTVSGDIRATLASVIDRDLSFDSISGNVTIEVPDELAAEFDLDTVSGSIRFDVPAATVESQKRRELKARTHGGGERIHLETISGNLTVQLASAQG